MNVQKFYEALAAIIAEREGVQIKVTVRNREEQPDNEKAKAAKHPAA